MHPIATIQSSSREDDEPTSSELAAGPRAITQEPIGICGDQGAEPMPAAKASASLLLTADTAHKPLPATASGYESGRPPVRPRMRLFKLMG